MKFAITILVCLGFAVAATTLPEFRIANKGFLEKQKFLLEIVYRVTDPLMFDEWIKLGTTFVTDRSYYKHYDYHMEKFWESYKLKTLLPRGEFFGALVETHHKQAWGLFNFFYFARDWETFMHNVCWARMHVNEGLFVYALSMAVIHREDLNGLVLPSIYEIFPQHFFTSDFIYKAEKYDYSVWKKQTMYELEYQQHFEGMDLYNHSYYGDHIKEWKMWQWWKQMGLDKHHWYAEDNYMLRETIHEVNQDPKGKILLNDLKMWWMPADYTRDIDFFNRESVLSYFTEDVGWMSFWYYLNMDQAFFLDSETFASNGRRGEFWLYAVHNVVSRYYMERLSHGFGEIPEFYWMQQIEHGYKPQLVACNGIGYSYRPNYYDFKTYANLEMFNKIQNAFQRIYDIIDMGYYRMHDGQIIDLRHENALEHISNLVQGNIDVFDKYFFNYYYLLSHMFISQVGKGDIEVSPSVMLNYETMVRDPYFYVFHKKIADAFLRFKGQLEPYSKEELMFSGVEIKEVQVTELVTFFDLVDFDVTTLLNDKMIFQDGRLVWDKMLLARQMRLNHKPFGFNLTVVSDKDQQALVRIFLAPKHDEFGRALSLADNRENFLTLGKFAIDLKAGMNVISYNSDEFYWTQKDRTTYTELYHNVMMAIEGKYKFPVYVRETYCLFPNRLILPRGWEKGMPMTMFFMVTGYEMPNVEKSQLKTSYSCGFGYGGRFTDDKPLFYPFDRDISEEEFFVPNMYFKDVEIYHHDYFKKYMEPNYQMKGKFDYTLLNSFYTK